MSEPVASLASLLSLAAERDPDGVAILDQGTTTSWTEAVAQSGRMAAALLDADVQPGDRVGVHYRKSADSFLAMHAVVQQGAIAVPLDPSASGFYLSSVIEQTGCRVVMTHPPCLATIQTMVQSSTIDVVLGVAKPTDEVSTPAAFLDRAAIDLLAPIDPIEVDLDWPAYIITTSGSTGRPKGICHTHRSAMAYVHFKEEAYDFGPGDRISDIAPNHFDISTLALWVTPQVGATNVVVAEQYQMFPASLSKLMAEEQISVWYSVPYLLTQLLNRGSLDEVDLTKLRWILFGGEVFPTEALRTLMDQMPAARFSNVYGPAEVNACTIHHLAGPPEPGSPIPIGQPVGDTQVQLVDDELNPKADEGEIWVQSPTMMREYWQQPELTSRAIWTDQQTGERWYRTGDLGWLDQNGDLVFAGRVDHQVKVRGHRVELEAIEAVLEDADQILHAIATVARNTEGSDIVISGVSLHPGSSLDVTALRSHCANRLPVYAVPVVFYPMTTASDSGVLTTGSGKLDRRTLRADLDRLHTSPKISPKDQPNA